MRVVYSKQKPTSLKIAYRIGIDSVYLEIFYVSPPYRYGAIALQFEKSETSSVLFDIDNSENFISGLGEIEIPEDVKPSNVGFDEYKEYIEEEVKKRDGAAIKVYNIGVSELASSGNIFKILINSIFDIRELIKSNSGTIYDDDIIKLVIQNMHNQHSKE